MMNSLGSCDTFVFLSSTSSGDTIFAKNSDRIQSECQTVRFYPRKEHEESTVRCTNFEIPQVEHTHAVLLSQPIWDQKFWGAEHGINEFGVCIGNEAVYSKEKIEPDGCLLGMDVVRIGLERGKTAKEALEIIIDIIGEFDVGGQGFEDYDFYYHNSYMISDSKEAFVLETAGKWWIVEEVKDRRHITNNYTVEKGNFMKNGLKEHLKKLDQGIKEEKEKKKEEKKRSDDDEDNEKDDDDEDDNNFSWRKSMTDTSPETKNFTRLIWKNPCFLQQIISCLRQMRINREEEVKKWMMMMKKQQQEDNNNYVELEDVLSILKSHKMGICMHNIFISSASMIALLSPPTKEEEYSPIIPFFTVTPHPCVSLFLPFTFSEDINAFESRYVNLWHIMRRNYSNFVDKITRGKIDRFQRECFKRTLEVYKKGGNMSKKEREMKILEIHKDLLRKFEISVVLGSGRRKKSWFRTFVEVMMIVFFCYLVISKFL